MCAQSLPAAMVALKQMPQDVHHISTTLDTTAATGRFKSVQLVFVCTAGAQQKTSEENCQAQKIALSRPPMRSQTWIGAGHLDRTKLGERISPSILAFKACCHPVDAV